MRRVLVLILISVCLISYSNIPVYAQNETASIIVEYKSDDKTIRDEIYDNFLGSVNNVNKIRKLNKYLDAIEFKNETAANDAIKNLNNNENVLIAEIDQKRGLMGVNPNDPDFSKQWGHSYIGATTAWEAVSYQQRRVVVAVIDTGVTSTHVDLNGKVLSGYNAVDGGTDTTDINGHGTYVSGVVAASTNNSKGIAGVTGTYDVVILPIKVLNDSTGYILSSYLIAAIDYATSQKVDVINMSLGGPNNSVTERNAIRRAKDAGIAIVASAGNDEDSTINYPASYDNVISVASHNSDGTRSDFSNYNEYVDITAPGYHINTTSKSGGYAYVYGTSFSSPYVAGVAAMIKAVAPSMTNAQITDILTASAVKPAGQIGRSDTHGYGYANAPAALKLTLGLDFSSTNISLNYDRVHLGSGLSSIQINATLSPVYNGSLVWYKNTDTAVTTGNTSYDITKGSAQSGSGVVTAKIPLNSTNAVTCQYSWTSGLTTTSLDSSITDVSVTGGTLLGEFHTNKTTYLINVDAIDIMPVVNLQLTNADVSYMIKNAKQLDDSTVITIMDSEGNSRIYIFTVTVIDEGIYPYIVPGELSTTFAVAAYMKSGNDYSLYMVTAMYNSLLNQLVKTELVEVNVSNGYSTYKTSFEVPDKNHVKIMFLEDLIDITPYKKVMVYP